MTDHPDARWFADRVRRSTTPRSGLALLHVTGSFELATTILRALEDAGLIRCAGPDPDCPRVWRVDLVGQLYEAA